MANRITWFEIPAADFERARKFYSEIFDHEIRGMNLGSFMAGFFPTDGEGVGGAIISREGFTPSADGSVVYLDGGDDLNEVLSRVEGAGGSVVQPKTFASPDVGYFAIFSDSEGNTIGLHSKN